MASQVYGLQHPGRDKPLGILGQIVEPIGAAGNRRILEFVHGPAATEAKIFKHLKGCVLCQNGYIKLAGSQNHIMGQIPLIDSDGDPLGGIGDLGNGIDDAAVVLLLIFCREDEQTIA